MVVEGVSRSVHNFLLLLMIPLRSHDEAVHIELGIELKHAIFNFILISSISFTLFDHASLFYKQLHASNYIVAYRFSN